MKQFISLFVFCLVSSSVLGVEFDRPCRKDVPAKENFNPNFFIGVWYELYSSLDQTGADCLDHHYTRRGNQLVFDVDRSGVLNGEYIFQRAVVEITNPEEDPITAVFNGTVFDGDESFEYDFRIYATDYTNYALLWSCTDLPDGRSREEGSVLGKRRTLTEAAERKVDSLLREVELSRENLREVIHDEETCLLVDPEPED